MSTRESSVKAANSKFSLNKMIKSIVPKSQTKKNQSSLITQNPFVRYETEKPSGLASFQSNTNHSSQAQQQSAPQQKYSHTNLYINVESLSKPFQQRSSITPQSNSKQFGVNKPTRNTDTQVGSSSIVVKAQSKIKVIKVDIKTNTNTSGIHPALGRSSSLNSSRQQVTSKRVRNKSNSIQLGDAQDSNNMNARNASPQVMRIKKKNIVESSSCMSPHQTMDSQNQQTVDQESDSSVKVGPVTQTLMNCLSRVSNRNTPFNSSHMYRSLDRNMEFESNQSMTLDHKYTRSQKVAFQLEEQLQLAYFENRKLAKEIEDRQYQINRRDDEIYVLKKQLEQRDSAIDALSSRIESEYSIVEDRIQAVVSQKDKEIDMLKQRLMKQIQHSDEVEKELDKMCKEKLQYEMTIKDIMNERDTQRKTVHELQSQCQDILSQQNEYKNIIRRMSTLQQNNKDSVAESRRASNKAIVTYEMNHHFDEMLIKTSSDEEEDLFPNEVLLIQENQKLQQKINLIQDLILSDKNHKMMKKEASEILNILASIEEFVNQQRGLIEKNSFYQQNFEDNFIKELADLNSEVITVRDLQKIKRKVQFLQSLLISPQMELLQQR